jgi:pyruvate,orthophosphate dikinase
MKELLGGKGAGLAEMTAIGLPVPGGFTITTEVCDLYYKNGKKYPAGLEEEVKKHLSKLEKLVGKSWEIRRIHSSFPCARVLRSPCLG